MAKERVSVVFEMWRQMPNLKHLDDSELLEEVKIHVFQDNKRIRTWDVGDHFPADELIEFPDVGGFAKALFKSKQ